jgi:hypothetical protein
MFGSMENITLLCGMEIKMKQSVYSMMEEAIVENNIDLNSPYKLERVLLIDKICDKVDWTEYNPFSAERKVRVIEKMVSMRFSKK